MDKVEKEWKVLDGEGKIDNGIPSSAVNSKDKPASTWAKIKK